MFSAHRNVFEETKKRMEQTAENLTATSDDYIKGMGNVCNELQCMGISSFLIKRLFKLLVSFSGG